jgi:hypothetical protein
MTSSLLPAAQWAQEEFGFAQLGDLRRNRRLINIAEHLAASPGGTLPQAFPDWAELKAAYRFFGQRGVTFERVLEPHLERTRQACREPGEYLLIEDTTGLDFTTHWATTGLGKIGDGYGRGFELHSTLAVQIISWTLEQRPEGTVVGLFGQQCLCRPTAPPQESHRECLRRARYSQRWAQALKSAGGPPARCQWTYVADREADFYEPIHLCQTHGLDFLIRSCFDRRLANGAGHLRAALQKESALGKAVVEVRARGGQPARTAIVELRSARMDLDGPWRPGGWKDPLADIAVVEAREIDPPEGIKEPLHWILLTSLPCATLAAARRVVGRYTARWWIEEYHKALKSGAGVEQSQLERGDRLEPLIAILAVVAVRLLNTKMLARSRPDSFEAAQSFGLEMLTILEKKIGRPKNGWTNQSVLVATARLGGFLGRKHDGMPGWQTIWRGWQRLMWMAEGLNILMESDKKCG